MAPFFPLSLSLSLSENIVYLRASREASRYIPCEDGFLRSSSLSSRFSEREGGFSAELGQPFVFGVSMWRLVIAMCAAGILIFKYRYIDKKAEETNRRECFLNSVIKCNVG